jgi:hypothetical protein
MKINYEKSQIKKYKEAKNEEFINQFEKFMKKYMEPDIDMECIIDNITKNDIQNFIDNFMFPNIDEYLANEYKLKSGSK